MDLKDKLAALGAATNGEIFDPEWQGGEWMVEAVETHETIDDFRNSSAHWLEKTTPKNGRIADFPFVAWAKMQAHKGQPRRALTVIDFGDVRFAIETDLSVFL